jgi:hypothetical protein
MEDEEEVKKICKNFEYLSDGEKKIILEEQYKKKKFISQYSVLGENYKFKYDTGKLVEK